MGRNVAHWRKLGIPVIALLMSIAVLSTRITPSDASTLPTLRAEMTTVAGSADAHNSEAAIGTALSNPALVQYAEELLAQGGTDLTAFQADLLRVIIDSAPYAGLFPALTSGGPLTAAQQQQLAALRHTLRNNPAIQLLISKGAQLKGDPTALTADIAATAATDQGPYPVPTPTGDAARDGAVAALANVFNGSSAFNSLASAASGVLNDPGAAKFIATLQPIVVASFIPPSQSIGFLLPNDRDPGLGDILKSGLEIIGGAAGLIAVIALAPEELAGLALVGVVSGAIAAVTAILVGLIDLGQALDCDHDGDPWDANDVVGIEC